MRTLRSALSLAVLISLAVTTAAPAAYLYPWAATPDYSDPVDNGVSAARDILGAWHAYDGASHYFRVDLRGAPSPGDYANIWGIYIDSTPGGGGHGDIDYIPDPLSGIDFIADSHYDGTQFFRWDYHLWSPYVLVFNYGPPQGHQETENAGTTLEWRITAGDIGTNFTFWAADLNFGSITHDITAPIHVPEVSSLLLGLLGLPMVTLRRR